MPVHLSSADLQLCVTMFMRMYLLFGDICRPMARFFQAGLDSITKRPFINPPRGSASQWKTI